MSIKHYYALAKPNLVYANLITLVAGYALGAGGAIRLWPFVATVAGAALGMASGCVCNNVIDRDIDARMRRTKHRAVASGMISGRAALAYAAALGIAGAVLFALGANVAAMAAGAVGFFFYVVMYSLWWKRRSTWGTAVGSVAGAVPPVVGYAAATGRVDVVAAILFAAMVAWQMPHFFAIAIRHADDYAAAGIPALPLVRGMRAAKTQMILYVAAFLCIAPLLSVYGGAGTAYLAVVVTLGTVWLALALHGLRVPDADAAKNLHWAKEMFIVSLVVMVGMFFAMTVSAFA